MASDESKNPRNSEKMIPYRVIFQRRRLVIVRVLEFGSDDQTAEHTSGQNGPFGTRNSIYYPKSGIKFRQIASCCLSIKLHVRNVARAIKFIISKFCASRLVT
jgi:hypothetical protein